MALSFEELNELQLGEKVWRLIQLGLAKEGLYKHNTFMGKPGPLTKAAFLKYMEGEQTPDEPAWMKIARKEMGVKEFAGRADNPQVVKYLKSVGTLSKHLQQNDETAWCSAFVNWCMEQCGIQGTEKANARSWLNWGAELETPKLGAVTILWRVRRTGWQGHVGFYVGEKNSKILMLGGNQSNEVNVSSYPKHRVLGYRWTN